ncbi:MAG TPA: hypothetical protein VHG08_02235 [Longimicrobium sp.]|nr:hypothetical protein [Longimicrobium sp.]
MKKLTLNLDELEVVSFDTSRLTKDNGTVQGYEWAWSDDSVCPTVTPGRPPLY